MKKGSKWACILPNDHRQRMRIYLDGLPQDYGPRYNEVVTLERIFNNGKAIMLKEYPGCGFSLIYFKPVAPDRLMLQLDKLEKDALQELVTQPLLEPEPV